MSLELILKLITCRDLCVKLFYYFISLELIMKLIDMSWFMR